MLSTWRPAHWKQSASYASYSNKVLKDELPADDQQSIPRFSQHTRATHYWHARRVSAAVTTLALSWGHAYYIDAALYQICGSQSDRSALGSTTVVCELRSGHQLSRGVDATDCTVDVRAVSRGMS